MYHRIPTLLVRVLMRIGDVVVVVVDVCIVAMCVVMEYVVVSSRGSRCCGYS